ncbi:hypothetical protein [Symbiopectobacterium sp. RP]|uniref:hypothetical protein n=1 Tax=Symbiopectobacterium sp. RP TaxID=3248553 RepID=UPI003D2BD5B3
MLHDLNLSIGGIDARLNRRYQRLLKQHMTPAAPLASAVKDLACGQKTTFATTQAVWRFFNIATRLNFDYTIWTENKISVSQPLSLFLLFAALLNK